MGMKVPDLLCHQRAGFEKMLDCFHYEGFTRQQVMDRWCLKPKTLRDEDGCREEILVGTDTTSCFSMNLIDISANMNIISEDRFSILIALNGEGLMKWKNG
jgi:mannose-6-phosphate isomerase